jgi:thiol-disulfide isomerase/thioredoxin
LQTNCPGCYCFLTYAYEIHSRTKQKSGPSFPVCLDEAVEADNEVRLIDMSVYSLQFKDFGFRVDHIDFWASWCPPCRYEFGFADTLHQFLQSQGIEILYISTDEEESKWHNVISNYNLEGYHYRISDPEMRKELKQIVHFLPTYMIIDNSGNIVVDNAERPHSKSKLYD